MGTLERLSVLVIVVIMVVILAVAVGMLTGTYDESSISSTPAGAAHLDVQHVTGGALTPEAAPASLEVPWGSAKKAIVILIGGDENHPDKVEAISISRGYGSTYSEDLDIGETFRIIKDEFAGRPRLLPVR